LIRLPSIQDIRAQEGLHQALHGRQDDLGLRRHLGIGLMLLPLLLLQVKQVALQGDIKADLLQEMREIWKVRF